jgi:uncharacterized protein YciI
MTDEEKAVWGRNFERPQGLMADGVMVLVGPTLGPVNTGIAVFEAPDEDAGRAIVEDDPTIAEGYAVVGCDRSGSRCCGAATEVGQLAGDRPSRSTAGAVAVDLRGS